MNRYIRCSLLLVAILFTTAQAWAESVCPFPQVGTLCTFHGYDYSMIDPVATDVSATCRAISDHLYVFVDNSLWDAGKVSQDAVDTVITAWEDEVPSDDMVGIYTKIAGMLNINPPNLFDHDARLYLVVHEIKDTSLFEVNAYFRPLDYEKDFNDPMPGSNGHDVLFIRGTGLDTDERLSDLTYTYSDLLHYTVDPNEVPWVRGVIGRAMALAMGYTIYRLPISQFAQDPSQSLLGDTNSDRTKLYPGPITLFGIFLSEIYPPAMWVDWTNSVLTGRDGFEAGLALIDPEATFCVALHDFAMRNGLNRGSYTYESYDPPTFAKGHMVAQVGDPLTSPLTLKSYAAAYLEIDVSAVRAQDQLELEISFQDTLGVLANTAKYSTSGSLAMEVDDVTVQSGQSTKVLIDDIGIGFDRVLLIISRCTAAEPILANVKATIVQPPVDGDEDEEFEEETETELDGDLVPIDGDEDDDLDEESASEEEKPDAIVSGSKTCPEINVCYTECETEVCENACVDDGTTEGRQLWSDFLYCISGSFTGGTDCLNLGSAVERERCMSQQCPVQYEACKIPEIDDGVPDDNGGGGCSETGTASAVLLLFALALAWCSRKFPQA
jgi:hypothetical protein